MFTSTQTRPRLCLPIGSRGLLPLVILVGLLAAGSGCQGRTGEADRVWGSVGVQPGQFVRPRGITVAQPPWPEEVFVVDFAGRIQVFDLEGRFLRGWQTPAIANGRPSGLSVAPDGKLLVADSHYNRILVYSRLGELEREIVGTDADGGPGPFAYLSDVVQDRDGFFYVSEFGDGNRIRKLDQAGKFVAAWSGGPDLPLARPRGLALGPGQEIIVADSCNHCLQVFRRDGTWLRRIGRAGSDPGSFTYPYKVAVTPGGELIVAEFGSHRVQRLSWEGEPLATWGRPGRGPGCLGQPWGVAVDAGGRAFIADTENHRIQRLRF
ncbi:MAG TPA: hypothetical protein PKC45_14615 [Gemmatales bacterium]|nr:hypothetical protein [Gemmatales bacterium]